MDEMLTEAMNWLGYRSDTLFLGQAVACEGTRLSASLRDVPANCKIEFPVAENLQLGVSLGLSLEGFVPVSIFPRWNFLLSATDQLLNHLDALPLYSDYRPRVLIRTAVGSKWPLDPGPQHDGDFTAAFRTMCRTIMVLRLGAAEDVLPAYQHAYESGGSALLVEG